MPDDPELVPDWSILDTELVPLTGPAPAGHPPGTVLYYEGGREVDHPERYMAPAKVDYTREYLVALDALVGDWLREYRSPSTRTNYARDLYQWIEFCHGYIGDWHQADRGSVARWAWYLENARQLKPATVARKVAAVSSFYRYAVTRGAVTANPAAMVRRPVVSTVGHAARYAVTPDEVRAMYAAATTPRDRALVVVLWTLALRITEAVALDLDGLAHRAGRATLLVVGKGGRTDEVPAHPVIVAAYREVMTAEDRTTGPVFVNNAGGRMTRAQASRVVARLGRHGGLEAARNGTPVRPHQLRAGAITAALDAGETLRDVQDLARHADPRTTRRYDAGRMSFDRHASRSLATALTDGGAPTDGR